MIENHKEDLNYKLNKQNIQQLKQMAKEYGIKITQDGKIKNKQQLIKELYDIIE